MLNGLKLPALHFRMLGTVPSPTKFPTLLGPSVTAPSDTTTVAGGVSISLGVSASSPDSDPLYYDASNLPSGLSIDPDTGVIGVGVGARGSDALVEAVRALDAAAIESHGLALRRPSLDDVFLTLTGHAAEDEQPNGRRRRPRGRRRADDEQTARAAS